MRLLVVGALVAPMVVTGSGVAAAAATPPPPARAASYAVTLLTGDRVDLTERADGRTTMAIQPASGREHVGFLTSGKGDDLTVLPADAADLVASGAVDGRLFQVRRLAHDGFDS